PDLIVVTDQPEVGAGPAMERLLALDQPPTAYCLPDTRLAAGAVAEMRRRGLELPPEALIFNGVPSVVRALGMTHYPRLIVSVELMAQHSLIQLQRLCAQPDAAPVQVLLPFELVDMPEPRQVE